MTASELHHTVVATTGAVPVETGRLVPDPGTRFTGAVAMSPDGHTLAVCSDSAREVALVDVTDPGRPRLRTRAALPDPCTLAEFSADARQLVVPTIGPTTMVFDTFDPDRPTVVRRLATGIGASSSAAYAHSGPLLATSGGDKSIRLWDVADPPSRASCPPSPRPPARSTGPRSPPTTPGWW